MSNAHTLHLVLISGDNVDVDISDVEIALATYDEQKAYDRMFAIVEEAIRNFADDDELDPDDLETFRDLTADCDARYDAAKALYEMINEDLGYIGIFCPHVA